MVVVIDCTYISASNKTIIGDEMSQKSTFYQMVSSITEGSGFVLDIIEQLKEPVNSHESRNDILPQNIVTKNYATKPNNNTEQAVIVKNGQHEINDTLEVSETHS